MKDNIKVGDYRILDYSYHQYKSFTVYKVLKINDDEYTIKSVLRSINLDPYGDYSFDEIIVGKSFAAIMNSEPINNKKVFNAIFEKLFEWRN